MFAGGTGATLHARMALFAESLESSGLHCNLITPINWQTLTKGPIGLYMPGVFTYCWRQYLKPLASKNGVVVIGRFSNLNTLALAKLCKLKGLGVVFDLDDAVFLQKFSLFGVNIKSPMFIHLNRLISTADCVTVNGHYLGSYAKGFNPNVTIVHDPVDVDLYKPSMRKSDDSVITIGWEGVPRNHYNNLKILLAPLKRLSREYRFKFKLVSYLGDPKVVDIFSGQEKFYQIDYGLPYFVSPRQIPALISDFDILLSPIQSTAWYEGKSAARAGMGMSMGIPVVASSAGEQKHVIKNGYNGFLAKTEDDWYRYLAMLIEDKNLRQKIGSQGRKTAEDQLSIKACRKQLLTAFNTITPLNCPVL